MTTLLAVKDSKKSLQRFLTNMDNNYYNLHVLPSMKRITPEELSGTPFLTYAPVKTWTSVPILTSSRGDIYHATIHLYHDNTGIVMMKAWEYDYSGPLRHPQRKNWMTIRFYKFSLCEHNYIYVKHTGNCIKEYKCDKCGMSQTIDSSD